MNSMIFVICTDLLTRGFRIDRGGGTGADGGSKVDSTRILSVWLTNRSRSVLQISPVGIKEMYNVR